MSDAADPIGDAEHSTPARLLASLSLMMFLQSCPLGVWGVTIGTYLAANTGDQGSGVYSAGFVGYSTAAGAIGGLVSPFVMGLLSDRLWPAQRLVSMLHFGCAASAVGMATSQSELGFFLCLVTYFQCYVPTVALMNKVALRHLAKADVEFPLVRLFGAFGWISAGIFVGLVWPWTTGESIEATRTPLWIGAVADVLVAIYAMTLPATPAERQGPILLQSVIGECRELLANRRLVAFLAISLFACVPSMAYNNYGNAFLNREGYPNPAALMTFGQVSEMMVLLVMPLLIHRLGLKGVLVAGMVAWTLRYVCLAAGASYGTSLAVYAAVLLHGPCFAFIYVAGPMYTDRLVGPQSRGAAQGLYALAAIGLGHLLGALTVGKCQELFLTPEGVSQPPYDWTTFWLVPAAISFATAIAFVSVMRGGQVGKRQVDPD
ncbi:putative nucleoside transporter YegT [Botrimarina colliarenosi]|uniref:Putative nucleoside transporter YegT n=1 Tax=Botrimarina colliarenosi TaxID=2528001 RepID=A0A5C6A0C8_9BACT|nr:MFS transporter [Botrimarina colliarenosi]TWT92866.1 putative nucleoside transporter YegT [Botrimarina colliarenosi]